VHSRPRAFGEDEMNGLSEARYRCHFPKKAATVSGVASVKSCQLCGGVSV
jgi:hypothetical protein